MGFSTLVLGMVGLGFVALGPHQLEVEAPIAPKNSVNTYAALKCKVGFKAGKTPISLKVGAKVSCYNIKLAAAGKKLLMTTMTKPCFACHSASGISPSSQMNNNLRTQGYTLKPADITLAFNAHVSEMLTATMSAAEAKAISNYLQSIK